MVAHDWISKFLEDLAAYCANNGLDETQTLVELTERVFTSECRVLASREMTVENHLAHVNRRPI